MATRPPKQNVGNLERLGCLALGIFLLLRGILSRRASRALAGGMFVYRGLSGHCVAYEAVGVDTRAPDERAPS